MCEIRFRRFLVIFGCFSFLFFGFNQNIDASEAITNSLGMKFVYIEPGEYLRGSPDHELGRSSDEIQHRVILTNGFYLQATEVTQGQWKAVMGSNPSYFSDCGDSCPVESVSWNDVQAFITKLNKLGQGAHRLPTEAEWEYAARSGSEAAFANGGITESGPGHDPNLDVMGWYWRNSSHNPQKVAGKAPNAWGLYDMHGNVWEWVQDWYGDYPTGQVTDPTGASSGSVRVRRGGSWDAPAINCRSANRSIFTPSRRSYNLGFRLIMTP